MLLLIEDEGADRAVNDDDDILSVLAWREKRGGFAFLLVRIERVREGWRGWQDKSCLGKKYDAREKRLLDFLHASQAGREQRTTHSLTHSCMNEWNGMSEMNN